MSAAKRRVLFVDNDPLVIRGFRRSVLEYADSWEAAFANSGAEALVWLAQQPMDVIITDMRMPGMDGNQLLEAVSQQYPAVVRFVLSGNTEDARIYHSTRLAHQFLAKPCEIETLWLAVEKSCRLRGALSNPNLLRVVTGLRTLPSLPTLYVRLVQMLESDNASPKAIGDVIAQDMTMTAKVLQLVNSAFFGLPSKVVSPHQAVSILGLNTIKALVLGMHVFEEYQNYPNAWLNIDQLWRHSLTVGALAKAIAARAGLPTAAQGEAQIAGTLHDIGKLLQLKVRDFRQRVKIVQGLATLDSEYKAYGVSHAELGAYLLGLWGLPETIVEAVAYHHYPASQLPEKFGAPSMVHVANGLLHLAETDGPENQWGGRLDLAHLQRVRADAALGEWAELARRMMGAAAA